MSHCSGEGWGLEVYAKRALRVARALVAEAEAEVELESESTASLRRSE